MHAFPFDLNCLGYFERRFYKRGCGLFKPFFGLSGVDLRHKLGRHAALDGHDLWPSDLGGLGTSPIGIPNHNLRTSEILGDSRAAVPNP